MSLCCHSVSTATHCSALQHIPAHCNTLQRTATHSSALQHTATHCNTFQHTATHCWSRAMSLRCHFVSGCFAVDCFASRDTELHCVALCCTVLHCVALCSRLFCHSRDRVAFCCIVLHCVLCVYRVATLCLQQILLPTASPTSIPLQLPTWVCFT